MHNPVLSDVQKPMFNNLNIHKFRDYTLNLCNMYLVLGLYDPFDLSKCNLIVIVASEFAQLQQRELQQRFSVETS